MDGKANQATTPLAAIVALSILSAIAAPAAAQAPPAKKPEAVIIQPGDIKWTGRPGANQVSNLYSGGSAPGKLVQITDWVSGQISHPHYHQRDRTFIVMKGHWDFAIGPKDDVSVLKALPEGTVVHVPAFTPFKDGCKQAPCLILTVGETGYPSTYVDEQGRDLPPAPPRPATPAPQGAQ